MTKADALVEKGAARLQALSRRAAESGGVKARLAPTLAEDATFLRRLKPSLMAARLRGEAPIDQEPGSAPAAPSGPQIGRRANGNGPNPIVVVGVAFAFGIVLARLVDWRGHAHPRD